MRFLQIRSSPSGPPQRVRLRSPHVTIGRAPENAIVLRDRRISRRHLTLEFNGDTTTLRDAGSTCGTMVNGARTTERILRDGDEIRIGSCLITFRDGRSPTADDDAFGLDAAENGADSPTMDVPVEATAIMHADAPVAVQDDAPGRPGEALERARGTITSDEDDARRMAEHNETATTLQARHDELECRADQLDHRQDDADRPVDAPQHADRHAPAEMELVRLRQKLNAARDEVRALRDQPQQHTGLPGDIEQVTRTPDKAEADSSIPAAGFPADAGPRGVISLGSDLSEATPVLTEILREKPGPRWRNSADRDYAAILLAVVLGVIGIAILMWALLA